ncbi:MAG: GIY-YIG nuclease family protein [Clostridia bacterium]|nr:GIY-YIG nuclease family protein [Clostridia bacterium]
MYMYYVYILTNKTDTVMYIGVTNDLHRRLYEHKNEQIEGFTKRYHVHKLVYFERYSEINDAIAREKQLKHWIRAKKDQLVKKENPNWDDLGEKLI